MGTKRSSESTVTYGWRGHYIWNSIWHLLVDSRCDGTQTQMAGGTERKTI